MNGGIIVQRGNQGQQFGLRGRVRQAMEPAGHAGFFAGFAFVSYVGFARGMFTHEHDG